MKKRFWLGIGVGLAVGLALGVYFSGRWVGAQEAKTLSDVFDKVVTPGLVPYTPTRLEWLEMELNAFHCDNSYSRNDTACWYLRRSPDTIVVTVRYFSTADRERLNTYVDSQKEVVRIRANRLGWTWVKVVEDVEMLKLK